MAMPGGAQGDRPTGHVKEEEAIISLIISLPWVLSIYRLAIESH